MAEQMPQENENNEQAAKAEKIKQLIGAKTQELQAVMQGEFGALQQTLQSRGQELQKRAQEGDAEAQAELKELLDRRMALARQILAILDEIKSLYAEIGQEEQFNSSQLGELYEQFNGMLEG